MNEIIDIRANLYATDVNPETLKAKPLLELIIIHTDGKEYKLNGEKGLDPITKISDARFIMNPETMDRVLQQMLDWRITLKNREDFWNDFLSNKTEETK
jgi:hypothetical protein